MAWEIEFFEDVHGRQPARAFIDGLDAPKKLALIAAIEVVLSERGLDVCRTEYGKQLGEGLFEFRLRHDEATVRGSRENAGASQRSGRERVLLRLFCPAYGNKVVLLLGGYDKGADPNDRRQAREIAAARKSLRTHKLRAQRQSKRSQRGG